MMRSCWPSSATWSCRRIGVNIRFLQFARTTETYSARAASVATPGARATVKREIMQWKSTERTATRAWYEGV